MILTVPLEVGGRDRLARSHCLPAPVRPVLLVLVQLSQGAKGYSFRNNNIIAWWKKPEAVHEFNKKLNLAI